MEKPVRTSEVERRGVELKLFKKGDKAGTGTMEGSRATKNSIGETFYINLPSDNVHFVRF